MPCQKLTDEKYASRPSPPYHAGECKDKTMPGNNGKLYKSVPDKRNVYTWKLLDTQKTPRNKTCKAPKSTRYTTTNNGENFWIVKDMPSQKRAIIYKNNVEPTQVAEIKYTNLFSPSQDSKKFMEGLWLKGNTILIQKTKDTFVLVYNMISEFKIKPEDTPQKFVSPIGNNDSPYPYLICTNNVYILYEPQDFACVPRDKLDLDKDVFDQYNGMNTFANQPPIKGQKIKSKTLFSPCDCRWRGTTSCSKRCPS
jgi:hypothetical protein